MLVLFVQTNVSGTESIFKNYTVSDGLITKSVTGFIQDHDGFLWIATTNGVSRFDGYEFRNFNSFDSEESNFQGTFVFEIAEGSDGKIWLSTDEGIEYYNKIDETFHMLIKGNMFKRRMNIDPEDNIWLTDSIFDFKVYKQTADSLTVQSINIPLFSKENTIIYNFTFHNNALWIASSVGIVRYDPDTKKTEIIGDRNNMNCSNIHKVDSSEIIMAFPSMGVCRLNTITSTATWITNQDIEEKAGLSIAPFDAIVDNDSALWISVSPGLVYIKDSTVLYYNSSSKEYYYEGNSFSSLYKDKKGNIWTGTFENGIFLKSHSQKNFSFSTELYKDDIKRTQISRFVVFDDNSLLYSDSKDVYFCENYKELVPGCAKKLKQNANLFPVNKDYCILHSADSAYIYNSLDKSVTFSHTIQAPACMTIDNDGIIWTGTWTGQLFGYDKKTNKKIEIVVDRSQSKQSIIFTITTDPDGSLWLGTFGKGLVHVSNQTAQQPTIQFYNKSAEGACFLNADMILCLHADMNNNLWVGTNGNGIARFDKSKKQFETFTTKNGLKSNIPESITSDMYGNIWIATSVISKYDIHKQTFTHYFQPDEIKSSFIVNACANSKSGDLLFASSRGMYVFNLSEDQTVEAPSSPMFTDFRIRGVRVEVGDTINGMTPYEKSLAFSEEISLPYALNSFSLVFASLEFNELKMINYQYKLEGVDNDWISTSAGNRIANYTGIQPGTYLFQVRAGKGSENWSEARTLIIRIIPPWWKTIWFRIAVILLISTIVATVFFMRIRNIKYQKKILEEQVTQRTNKLTEANTLLQQSHLVLEMKNEQLEESLKTKDTLIRVIAHDFRNPLAAIIGTISILKNRSKQLAPQRKQELLSSIDISASNLNIQMGNVLDWALAENQEIVYKPNEINIEVLINDAVELVKKSAEEKNISISTQLEYETNSYIDPRMISTVIRNLLINAIKFTPRNGSIAILVQEYENEMEVSVVDSGIGISQDSIQSILNTDKPFATSDTENTISYGIGLRLSKHFIEENKGVLQVRSQENRGSVFNFTIPKGEQLAAKIFKIPEPTEDTKNGTSAISVKKDKSITILIIEDNKDVLEMLNQLFSQYYKVITASDGQSGLQLANNIVPSLIISDITLPKISGIDICQALKKEEMTHAIPIILITANEQLMSESYASGADDFIVKPFDEYELLLKINSLLENRKRLLVQIQSKTGNTPFLLPESYDDAVMNNLLLYINEHFCETNVDINSIADKVGLGRTQLWRKFKSATGQNLSDYIKSLRLAKAREMLLTGKYKVAEVGYETGFSNPAYFTKCFTAHYGYTPKECLD